MLCGRWYGVGAYPLTRAIVQALNGAFTVIPMIIAVFYSGELVWRDRDRRMLSLASYRTAAPDWEVVLDLDALARAEGEDWVWHGCTSLPPATVTLNGE